MSQTGNIPWPNPQANPRDTIVDIELTLDTTLRTQLTGDFVNALMVKINTVHVWLRSPNASSGQYSAGIEAVLTYIRTAERLLAGAVNEYKKKGQSQAFFKFVDDGREQLEKAKNAW